jgi:hypothetical protein
MLKAAIIVATLGAEVSVPITQTDGAGGVQVDIVYDSAALTFVAFEPTTESQPYFTLQNNPPSDSYRVLFSSTEPLPELLGHIKFIVNGPSDLLLKDVVLATPLGESIDAAVENGRIEVITMDLQFTVPEFQPGVPTPASADGTRIYEADNSDLAAANVVAVIDIPAPGLIGTGSVASNRGNRWYFARYFNEGGPGPAGPTTQFDTNVPPTEVPGAVSIAVV